MDKKSILNCILNSTYAVLSDNRYTALMIAAMLVFGLSYAILPIVIIPGARLSLASLLNSFSALDTALLLVMSVIFGLVTSMQVYEIKRIAGGFRKKQGVGIIGTVTGIIAAKSCCILPLILLMLGSLSSALIVSLYLTEIRMLAAVILVAIFLLTSVRIGKSLEEGRNSKSCCR